MQLISKIDETFTHDDAPFMIMAGHTARLGQWNRFDQQWRKKLRKSGLSYFHAKEHFDHPFAFQAPRIAEKNLMFGFVVVLRRDDYERHYRSGNWGGKAQPDSMYGLCFRYCLSFVLAQGRHELPRTDLRLDFIVESGHKNEGAASAILDQLKRKKIGGVSEYLGEARPGEKKAVPGLQAADGLAYGAWHMEENVENILGRPQLAPFKEASATSASRMPTYRCDINAEELQQFREDYFLHIEYRRAWGQQRNAEIKAKHGS